jgi:hypothetical protein
LNETDLQTTLNEKAVLTGATFTGQVNITTSGSAHHTLTEIMAPDIITVQQA